MTKPAVIWATQIFIAWFAIGAAGRAFLAVIGTLNGRCTIAQGVGGFLFPPQEPVADQELAGAAVAEVLRYVLVLGMIVWLSVTRRAAEYLASGLPHRTEDART